ncbi:MAG: metalloregulator ArsR/SmtB family transcription factor [Anaerolineales bacterium]
MYDLQEAMVIEQLAEEQAKFCSVFSNARRIQILWALADRELSVGAIAEAVGSSLQNVSQHLSRMKDSNLVSSRREGQTVYYRIKRETLREQCRGLLQENAYDVRNEDQ